MTESLAQLLRLLRTNKCLTVTSVGESNSIARSEVTTTLYSQLNGHIFTSEFWVLGTITSNQPDNILPARQWKNPAGVDFADPESHMPQKFDILLGADSFFDLLCSGQIKLTNGGPLLQKTLLGWVVSGRCRQQQKEATSCIALSKEDIVLGRLVERLWEFDTVPENKDLNKFLTRTNCL